jgi:phosphate transport system permease protein
MPYRHPDLAHIRGRRIRQSIFRGLTILSLVLVVGPALLILYGIVSRAVPHWQWSVLVTPTDGVGGGLSQDIVGTLVLMAGVLVVAGTTGVLAGIYLSEMAPPSGGGRRMTTLFRSATDVLSGVPSITLGFVAYVALVVGLHWGFSLLPAVIVLSVMVIPYIAKATETALSQVPTDYREGAQALGMSPSHVLRKIVIRSAIPGIVTGLLLALAIAGGETAPLLLTAGNTSTYPTGALIHQPIGYLTYPVWTFYNYPSNQAHYLAYDAALILIVLIMVLLIVSRIIVSRTQRYTERTTR